MIYSLQGAWQARLADGRTATVQLPGTMDQNGVGNADVPPAVVHPDEGSWAGAQDPNGPIITRFTRRHTYEGAVVFSRVVEVVPPAGQRIFLRVERARCLQVRVNGQEAAPCEVPTLSTPQEFELTGLLQGRDLLEIVSDNSYPGLPHDAIVYSSAATDETQTNWNGLLGDFCLESREPVFLRGLRVYPRQNRTLTIRVEIDALHDTTEQLTVRSPALQEPAVRQVALRAGCQTMELCDLALRSDCKLWEEDEGFLYEVQAELSSGDRRRAEFGIREFRVNEDGRLCLNGRAVFLRGEANCAVFPQTGHPPMTVREWTEVLEKYRAYGVNCMRFHSHCPPEAAFCAADRMGMLMQPELSHWNPKNAMEEEPAWQYYQRELHQILRVYANHPSFVMLTFGNELQAGEEGHRRMDTLLEQARQEDPTRLYADSSNAHYGEIDCNPHTDFYASQAAGTLPLRATFACHDDSQRLGGDLNNRYPDALVDYSAAMEKIRTQYQGAVFGFEVGQFQVLPDFGQLRQFTGVCDPVNLAIVQDTVEQRGMADRWLDYIQASGELALLCYRAEVEAALRTEGFSGLSLLGLQDFPGQGTALVGMMDSYLEPKPFAFAQPERFRAFFGPRLPLVLLPRYTWQSGQKLTATVKVANYAREALEGPVHWTLESDTVALQGQLPPVGCPAGTVTTAGTLEVVLPCAETPLRLTLRVQCGDACNTYPLWVYPPVKPECPKQVYQCERLDDAALAVLQEGGTVYLSPAATETAMPASIRTQFSTDFWSSRTFPKQPGGMGQWIDREHPLFRSFPTESHTNWQWWPMATQRAVEVPAGIRPMVAEMDDIVHLRNLAQLFECRCAGGKVLFSSFGLQDLQQYPEARALLHALYTYMDSPDFCPVQEMNPDFFR